MEPFKDWYMDMSWKFDDLFVISAKFLGITYFLGITSPEFVFISLCIVWPLAMVSMMVVIMKLWRDNNRLKKALFAQQIAT